MRRAELFMQVASSLFVKFSEVGGNQELAAENAIVAAASFMDYAENAVEVMGMQEKEKPAAGGPNTHLYDSAHDVQSVVAIRTERVSQ